jgi:3-phenylpropionate/cinnamic acid dioxygenase small subunit
MEIARRDITREIEELFYTEADLLDERRFEEWLELLTDDIRYVVPVQQDVKDGKDWKSDDVAWFDEGKETLTQRVHQLRTGVHWAEEPPSRVSHMISNIRVLSTQADEAVVRSRFLVYRSRLADEVDVFVGRRDDVLRDVGGAWKIARRTVLLDQNVLLAKNLTIFF